MHIYTCILSNLILSFVFLFLFYITGVVDDKSVKILEDKSIPSTGVRHKAMFAQPDAWYNFCFKTHCIGKWFYACWCCYYDDKCFGNPTDCSNHCIK